MTTTSAMPTVTPRPYSDDELRDVEEVLRVGAAHGHTAGVLVLRRAIDAQREFLALAQGFQFLVPPAKPGTQAPPSAPAGRIPAPRKAIETENAQAPVRSRCRHSHPTKGPCRRPEHPGSPNLHDYHAPVSTRPVPGVTFSSAESRRAG